MARRSLRAAPSKPSSVLLVTVGALAGIALGLYLADRSGVFDRSAARRSRPLSDADRGRPEHDDWDDEEADHDDWDDAPDAGPMASGASIGAEAITQWTPTDDTHAETDALGLVLEQRVLEVFLNDPILAGRAIDIGAVGNGVIELTGWVHTAPDVTHAITLARGVPGVRAVESDLSVRAPKVRRRRSRA